MEDILDSKSNIGKRKNRRKLAQENQVKDSLKQLILDRTEQKALELEMDEEEIMEHKKKQAKIVEMYRDDVDQGYQPVIIKASTAGALETLISEAEKIIGDQFKIQIVQTGVGSLTEKDLNDASAIGAVLIGFDITASASINSRVEAMGITVRFHKLIYKF